MIKNKMRAAKGPCLCLEDSDAFASYLIEVKTSKDKKKTIEQIKGNLASWLNNRKFNIFRDEILDLAIVASINRQRMNTQDVDNIAKIVLDALKRNKNIDLHRDIFLFNDDSQIIRLLIYKISREEDEIYDTDRVDISFRVHDPKKPMIIKDIRDEGNESTLL